MKVMSVPTGLTILAILAVIYFQRHDREGGAINNEEDFAGLSTRTGETHGDSRRLSRRGIIEEFPAALPMIGAHGLTEGQEDQFKIFVELGALEHEAAVDYIFERYGRGHSSYLPMTFAMTGWMETDLEAAINSFKGFLKRSPGAPWNPVPNGLFQWKGVDFHSSLA